MVKLKLNMPKIKLPHISKKKVKTRGELLAEQGKLLAEQKEYDDRILAYVQSQSPSVAASEHNDSSSSLSTKSKTVNKHC